MMKAIFRNEKGIALVIVIWMLVLLTVLSSELVASVRGDVRAVTNYSEDREAYFLAYAGVQMAVNEILHKYEFNFEDAEEGMVFAKSDAGNLRFEINKRKNVLMGNGYISYRFEDENRKLNLNALARNPARLSLLFDILFPEGEVDNAVAVDSIVDWVDTDDLSRSNGAESEYYESQTIPYKAKNADFETVNELRKVKGISEHAFQTLSGFLTVYPAGGINENTAPPEVLFVSGRSEEEIDEILITREMNGFASLTGKSDVFTIVSSGRFPGNSMAHHIRAVVKRLSNGNIAILDWTDDYYGDDYVPADSEEPSPKGRVGGE